VELHEFQLELAASTYTSASLKRGSKNLRLYETIPQFPLLAPRDHPQLHRHTPSPRTTPIHYPAIAPASATRPKSVDNKRMDLQSSRSNETFDDLLPICWHINDCWPCLREKSAPCSWCPSVFSLSSPLPDNFLPPHNFPSLSMYKLTLKFSQ
jgi:hypothetical protein